MSINRDRVRSQPNAVPNLRDATFSHKTGDEAPSVHFNAQALEEFGFAVLGPDRFVNWAWGQLQSNGKRSKPPMQPSGAPASTNRSEHRGSFYQCAAAVKRPGSTLRGIGLQQPAAAGLTALDLDHCVTIAEDGSTSIDQWAAEITDDIGGYTEISPSGDGLRIVVRGLMPPLASRQKKIPILGARPGAQVQFFTDNGYTTLTGNVLPGCDYHVDNGEDRSDALLTVHQRVCAVRANNAQPETALTKNGLRLTGRVTLDLLTSIELSIRETGLKNVNLNTLHVRGDTSKYPSRSEADAALARLWARAAGGITSHIHRIVAIERLMRESALYREKWDKHPTYLRDTIQFVQDESFSFCPKSKASLAGALNLIDLRTVRFERVQWFEEGIIPIAEFTLISGDGGIGKTSAVLDTLARASANQAMPSGLQHKRPLRCLVVAEEDRHGLLRAKLQAAGADLDNIRLVDSAGRNRDFMTFPRHTAMLRDEVISGAWDVVFIDSLLSHIDETINASRPQEVRRAIRPLVDLAHETGVTIIAIRHLTKGGGPASSRGFGSAEFRNLCRSELLVAEHRDQDAHPGLIVMTLGKTNVSADRQQTVGFQLRSIDVKDDDGIPTTIAVVDWESLSWISPSDLLDHVDGTERSRIDAAVEWLRLYLSNGPRRATDVRTAGNKEGHARATIYRARSFAGIVSNGGVWQLSSLVSSRATLSQPKLPHRPGPGLTEWEIDFENVPDPPLWWAR